MTPHKWGVVERRFIGWDKWGKSLFSERVSSRHKTGLAAKEALSSHGQYAASTAYVRRLRQSEK